MVILLEYDNGWTHDDHRRYPLGIFENEFEARQAAIDYLTGQQDDWGWHRNHHCRLAFYTLGCLYGQGGPDVIREVRIPLPPEEI